MFLEKALEMGLHFLMDEVNFLGVVEEEGQTQDPGLRHHDCHGQSCAGSIASTIDHQGQSNRNAPEDRQRIPVELLVGLPVEILLPLRPGDRQTANALPSCGQRGSPGLAGMEHGTVEEAAIPNRAVQKAVR